MASLRALKGAKSVALVATAMVALFGLVGVRGLVGIADGATTQTRAASCSAYGFLPDQSGTTYAHAPDTELYGEGSFVCDIDLPNRAVVTKVEFTINDAGSGGGVDNCGLVRVSLAAAGAGTFSFMASFPPSNNGNVQRLSTTTITNPTIDTMNYGYELQCTISGNETNFGVYGATVVYKISSANG